MGTDDYCIFSAGGGGGVQGGRRPGRSFFVFFSQVAFSKLGDVYSNWDSFHHRKCFLECDP